MVTVLWGTLKQRKGQGVSGMQEYQDCFPKEVLVGMP